jgi:hypothetical protein
LGATALRRAAHAKNMPIGRQKSMNPDKEENQWVVLQ